MKYKVIARKFRPQVFEEVVGQDPIVQTLRNAIEMDRIGHAYLFCGPRGVGKTTTARLLAKALNCVQSPTPTPCNECPSCMEITAGASIDVLEIDAASNTGVDSIRELRENARYAPSRDRFKIFIVDEVHMLSTSAFNALLKILEEPPEHIAFIMATTERHKLPATILSRCQQFVFRTIPPAAIQTHLQSIAEREGVKIGETALSYVVKAAEGSMRDAQSLLDQIIAFGGQDIGDGDVRDVLGFIPTDILDRSVNALIHSDSKALISVVEIVVNQGLNLQRFVREFLSRIRDLLLAKLGIEDKILGSSKERAQIAAQAGEFSEQDLIRLFDMLLKLENDLRWTSEPRFHLEVGCVKLTKVGKLRDIEDVIRQLKDGSSSQPQTHKNPSSTSRTKSRIENSGPSSAILADEKSKPSTLNRPESDRTIEPNSSRSESTANGQRSHEAPSPAKPKRHKSHPLTETSASSGSNTFPKTSKITPNLRPPIHTNPSDATRKSVENETLVQSFLDVFKGQVVGVRNTENIEVSDTKPETEGKDSSE